MRARILAVLVAVLGLSGTASAFLVYTDAVLWDSLKYRRGSLKLAPGPGDEVLIREIDRVLRLLDSGFRTGIAGRIRVSDRVAARLRRAFPGDVEFEYYLALIRTQVDQAVRGDAQSLSETIDHLPPGEPRDTAHRLLGPVDRHLEAASADPERSGWHLSRAMLCILAAESAISGGREAYFRARIPGSDPFRPNRLEAGAFFGILLLPEGFVGISARDGRSVWTEGRDYQPRYREMSLLFGPSIRGPGTYSFGSEEPLCEFYHRKDGPSEAEEGAVLYCSGGCSGFEPRTPSGTVTIRTWLPGAGIIEGSFSCTVFRGLATGTLSNAEEELRIEGEFRCTDVW